MHWIKLRKTTSLKGGEFVKLKINGELITVPTTINTIMEIIEHFKISNPIVIVEHNDTILEKDAHAVTKVADGDKIELVQFVGGG